MSRVIPAVKLKACIQKLKVQPPSKSEPAAVGVIASWIRASSKMLQGQKAFLSTKQGILVGIHRYTLNAIGPVDRPCRAVHTSMRYTSSNAVERSAERFEV